MVKACAIDIGGTSVKSAYVEFEGTGIPTIGKHFPEIEIPSKTFDELRDQILGITHRALEKGIRDFGISTAGSVRRNGEVVRFGVFEGYRNVSWESILRHSFGDEISRVLVENDANAASWAEYEIARKEKTLSDMVHIVVGTGVGGGVIVGSELVIGGSGFAGEIGHMVVDRNSELQCACDNYGCVELYAGAKGIVRYIYDNLDSFPGSPLSQASPNEITIKRITEVALDGDQLANDAFVAAGSWLGIVLSYIMNLVSPELITIGGGIIEASKRLAHHGGPSPYVSAAIESAQHHTIGRIFPEVEIREGSLGNEAALLGVGAKVLRQN